MTTSNFFPSYLNAYPVAAPYVAAIPEQLIQGDSGQWVDVPFTDDNGNTYQPGVDTLAYTIAGPIAAPLTLTATTVGGSWQTNLSTTQSATLVPGLYWWVLQASQAGVRVTVANGELTVYADLTQVGANYDQRTVAEKGLAAAESALIQFQATGGRIKEYVIGSRHMTFQNDQDILMIVQYWRNRVVFEKMKLQGTRSRLILARFQRAR